METGFWQALGVIQESHGVGADEAADQRKSTCPSVSGPQSAKRTPIPAAFFAAGWSLLHFISKADISGYDRAPTGAVQRLNGSSEFEVWQFVGQLNQTTLHLMQPANQQLRSQMWFIFSKWGTKPLLAPSHGIPL